MVIFVGENEDMKGQTMTSEKHALRDYLMYQIEVGIINRGLYYFLNQGKFLSFNNAMNSLDGFINWHQRTNKLNPLRNYWPIIEGINTKINHPRKPLEQCFKSDVLTTTELDELQDVFTSINLKHIAEFKMNTRTPFGFEQWRQERTFINTYNNNSVFNGINVFGPQRPPVLTIKKRVDRLLSEIEDFSFNKDKIFELQKLLNEISNVGVNEGSPFTYEPLYYSPTHQLCTKTVQSLSLEEFLKDMKKFYKILTGPYYLALKDAKNFSSWFNNQKYFLKTENKITSTLLTWHIFEQKWLNEAKGNKSLNDESFNKWFELFDLQHLNKEEESKQRKAYIKGIKEKVNIFEKSFKGAYPPSRRSNKKPVRSPKEDNESSKNVTDPRYRNILDIYWQYILVSRKGLPNHSDINGQFLYFKTQFNKGEQASVEDIVLNKEVKSIWGSKQ